MTHVLYEVISVSDSAMFCLLMWLILVQLIPPSVCQCPTGFSEVHGTWCYLRLGQNKYQENAGSTCSTKGEGAKLVDVETRDEMMALLPWMISSK